VSAAAAAAVVETRHTEPTEGQEEELGTECHEKSGRSVFRLEGQSSRVGLTSRFCGAIALEVT